MRLLIVRLSSFGDVVHTFPALTDLADARPDIAVDWLVDESFAGFARLHPAVGEIIAADGCASTLMNGENGSLSVTRAVFASTTSVLATRLNSV